MKAPSPALLLGASLLATALLAGCSAGVTAEPAAVTPKAAFHGTEPVTPPARPSFVLDDTSGQPYDFGAQTRGRPTLLYFGYANCPDECPTAMAAISAALRTAPAALREQTAVVFVTTDPERDTAPVLRRFLDQFSVEAVGLRGTPEQVAAAQEAAGVPVAAKGEDVATLPGRPDEHVHQPGTAPHQHFGPLGYGVGHADVILAFDTGDRQPVLYDGGVRPSDLAADLPLLAPGENP